MWQASKILGVPIFSPKLKDYNVFDLELMEWLTLFEDSDVEERFKRTLYDDDYDSLSEDINSMAIDPNMSFEEEQELLQQLRAKRDAKYKEEDELEKQQELDKIYDDWVEIVNE